MFTKVIATGEFFIVGSEAAPDKSNLRVATLPLSPEKLYMGNLFPGSQVGLSIYVEIDGAETAWFKGSELEAVPSDGLTLMPSRSQSEE